MFYDSSIFKTNIYIVASTISNDSSFHAAVHHACFAKAGLGKSFNVWIGDFTLFKCIIRLMFYYSPIFETNIYIGASTISNNCGFHSTVHHMCFAKTSFGKSFNVWIGYSTFFKCLIRFMFYYSPIFETNIYIVASTISNNSSFYTTIHHSGFAKSICFCCHKLSLIFMYLFLPFIYVRISQILIISIQLKKDTSFRQCLLCFISYS